MVTKHDLRAIYNGKCGPKRLALIINFSRAQKEKSLVYRAGAAFFRLEPEPTQFGWSQSRSRLRDLGRPEPEPPKKVAAPQHSNVQYSTVV